MNNYSSTVASSSSKYFTREGAPTTDEEILSYSYRSALSPRSTTIARKSVGRTMASSVFSSASSSNFGQTIVKPTNPGMIAISETREKDKRELGFLNDRFASYVERVRFLEVHNKKLQMELEALKNRSQGDAVKVKEMFEIELREAKMLIEQTSKDKAAAELRMKVVEEEAEKFRRRYNELLESRNADKLRIEELSKQIGENEADINVLKRRLADLEEEAKRYKAETHRLFGEMQRINAEIEAENLRRVKLENEKAAMEEELGYLRVMHNKQLEEIRNNSFVEIGLDSSQFFKSELAMAIRDIRNEYETINANQKAEIEQWYRVKIQDVHNRPRVVESTENLIVKKETERLKFQIHEIRKEIAAMKARNAELEIKIKELEEMMVLEERDGQILIRQKDAEIAELRRRQAELLADLDELTKVKTSLEEEIMTYRRLLEGDNNKDGLRQVVEGIEQRAKTLTITQAAIPATVGGSSSSYSHSYKSSSGGYGATSSGSYGATSGGYGATSGGYSAASKYVTGSNAASNLISDLASAGGAASSSFTMTKVRQYQY